MTIKQNPLQAANSAYLKMRADYRAKRVFMDIEIKDDAYVDKPSGLLDGPKLNDEGLTLTINEWANTPPDGIREYVQMQIDRGDGNFVNVGPRKEYMVPVGQTDFPPGTFPSDFVLSTNDLPESAACRFRFIHTNFDNVSTESNIKSVICDRQAPDKDQIPQEPVIATQYLDDTNLPVGGRLPFTIPGYSDWEPTDKVAVYLFDAKNVPEDPTKTKSIFFDVVPSPGISATTIQIDADKIRAYGDIEGVLTYVLIDKALNPSPPALYKKVSVTLGLLPLNLKKPRIPQAVPGPLTLAHAQDGVSVWPAELTPNRRLWLS